MKKHNIIKIFLLILMFIFCITTFIACDKEPDTKILIINVNDNKDCSISPYIDSINDVKLQSTDNDKTISGRFDVNSKIVINVDLDQVKTGREYILVWMDGNQLYKKTTYPEGLVIDKLETDMNLTLSLEIKFIEKPEEVEPGKPGEDDQDINNNVELLTNYMFNGLDIKDYSYSSNYIYNKVNAINAPLMIEKENKYYRFLKWRLKENSKNIINNINSPYTTLEILERDPIELEALYIQLIPIELGYSVNIGSIKDNAGKIVYGLENNTNPYSCYVVDNIKKTGYFGVGDTVTFRVDSNTGILTRFDHWSYKSEIIGNDYTIDYKVLDPKDDVFANDIKAVMCNKYEYYDTVVGTREILDYGENVYIEEPIDKIITNLSINNEPVEITDDMYFIYNQNRCINLGRIEKSLNITYEYKPAYTVRTEGLNAKGSMDITKIDESEYDKFNMRITVNSFVDNIRGCRINNIDYAKESIPAIIDNTYFENKLLEIVIIRDKVLTSTVKISDDIVVNKYSSKKDWGEGLYDDITSGTCVLPGLHKNECLEINGFDFYKDYYLFGGYRSPGVVLNNTLPNSVLLLVTSDLYSEKLVYTNFLLKDGKAYTGKISGIACIGNYVFISDNSSEIMYIALDNIDNGCGFKYLDIEGTIKTPFKNITSLGREKNNLLIAGILDNTILDSGFITQENVILSYELWDNNINTKYKYNKLGLDKKMVLTNGMYLPNRIYRFDNNLLGTKTVLSGINIDKNDLYLLTSHRNLDGSALSKDIINDNSAIYKFNLKNLEEKTYTLNYRTIKIVTVNSENGYNGNKLPPLMCSLQTDKYGYLYMVSSSSSYNNVKIGCTKNVSAVIRLQDKNAIK